MFNIIYIAYNPQKEILDIHLKIWSQIPEEIRKNMRFILVDDCSKEPIDLKINFKINLIIPRVLKDIYWNPPGAKNLGFLLADNDWIFSCDIDHTSNVQDYIDMYNLNKERGKIYLFERFRSNGAPRNKNTSNIFIMHREDFWKTGGYDEDFSGCHGYDDYVFIGDLMEKVHYPSLIELAGLKLQQTKIRIYEYEGFATGERTIKMETHKVSYPLMQQKREQLAKDIYEHGSIIRFPWKINKEYKFEDNIN